MSEFEHLYTDPNKEFIIEQFLKVKALGFVKSNRENNTGIGKTFEDYMGVVENNIDKPDLAGYEIKTHREDVGSYVTIFTKSPSFPKGANAYLKDKFGSPYEDNPQLKKLHTSMFANKGNTHLDRYSFRLINDADAERVYIAVHSLLTGDLLDMSCGYTYYDVQKVLLQKLNNLFYVKADRRYADDGTELFHFNYAEIYGKPSLDLFLKMLDEGLIMYDIRIGSYPSGDNYGKPHDHGSGFRILDSNLHLLYADKEVIGDGVSDRLL
ncbi:MAG: MvaI/BcnI family restriction endonuclease [Bacteroidales bacterium]|nr:MvaI/BcnI family restriction endonuclease [Bacteroidales bacterium]